MQRQKEKRIFLIVGAVMIVTELIKQLLLTFVVGGGSYQWWYFPWQLCSLPMYVCLLAGLCKNGTKAQGKITTFEDGTKAQGKSSQFQKDEKIYGACLAFLSDFGLLAGICAFLDTSGFQYPLVVLTVHSYLWHFALIAIGIYAWMLRAKRIRARTAKAEAAAKTAAKAETAAILGGLCIYIIGCIIAEIINVLAFDSGHKPINMFYISPRYTMTQIYIRDLVPVIGNTACILLYIALTIVGAALIELIGNCIINICIKK